MAKWITPRQAAALIPEGASIMVGGFMGCGNAHEILAELAELGTKNLTVISNDAAIQNGPNGHAFYGLAKLVHNRQIKKLIASHVGLNPEVAQQMNEGTLELVLVPQGSLAEMIRAGGAGLGGVLTPTGVGTIVEDAEHVHSVMEIGERKYLLEKPLRADFALISAFKADRMGNAWYKGTTRNFNLPMATAADIVILEAEHVVEVGEIEPENIMTQSILVDYAVDAGGKE